MLILQKGKNLRSPIILLSNIERAYLLLLTFGKSSILVLNRYWKDKRIDMWATASRFRFQIFISSKHHHRPYNDATAFSHQSQIKRCLRVMILARLKHFFQIDATFNDRVSDYRINNNLLLTIYVNWSPISSSCLRTNMFILTFQILNHISEDILKFVDTEYFDMFSSEHWNYFVNAFVGMTA